MSPQSTLSKRASFTHNGCTTCYDLSVGLSKSQLVQAADESFSMHKRLDSGLVQTALQSMNPLDHLANQYPLKKRRISICTEPSDDIALNYNVDFLSGIFQDVANMTRCNSSESKPLLDSPSSLSLNHKKHRVSLSRSLSRRSKSYACLDNFSSALSPTQTSDVTDADDHSIVHKNTGIASEAVKTDNVSSIRFPQAQTEASMFSLISGHILNSIIFPNLPATVSENSCSVEYLTQTSMRAAKVSENPQLISGIIELSVESYGWFVEVDDIQETRNTPMYPASKRYPKADLSFTICTAPKKDAFYEAEVEWAKAADTVDNVLGDLLF